MSLFLLLNPGEPHAALDDVLRYTHYDRYPALNGYTTFSPHWHYAYTVQAMEKGYDWVPPFKPVLQAMGVPVDLARTAIRVSLGWRSVASDIDRFMTAWRGLSAHGLAA